MYRLYRIRWETRWLFCCRGYRCQGDWPGMVLGLGLAPFTLHERCFPQHVRTDAPSPGVSLMNEASCLRLQRSFLNP